MENKRAPITCMKCQQPFDTNIEWRNHHCSPPSPSNSKECCDQCRRLQCARSILFPNEICICKCHQEEKPTPKTSASSETIPLNTLSEEKPTEGNYTPVYPTHPKDWKLSPSQEKPTEKEHDKYNCEQCGTQEGTTPSQDTWKEEFDRSYSEDWLLDRTRNEADEDNRSLIKAFIDSLLTKEREVRNNCYQKGFDDGIRSERERILATLTNIFKEPSNLHNALKEIISPPERDK